MKSGDIEQVIKWGSATPELQDLESGKGFFDAEMLQGYIDSPNDIAWILEIEQKIGGFLLCQFNSYTKIAYLEDILILPSFQGQEYGQFFFDELSEYLKGESCVNLWALVHEKNDRMMGFLTKKGFEKGRKFILFDKDVK